MDTEEYRNRMYPRYAQEIVNYRGIKIKFIHFMIEDFGIQSNEATNEFVQMLTNLVWKGEILYIHCLGGHGRTGTISVPLLISLYGLSEKEARKKVNYYHKARSQGHNWCSMPEDESQVN